MEIYPGDKVSRSVKVLWPDGPRWVNEEWVKTAASNSWYNNADELICCRCGLNALTEVDHCYHDADCRPVYKDGSVEPRSLEECIDWLEDTGEVTFGRR